MTRKKAAEAETPITLEQPTRGGSYIRDPETGALQRVEGPEEEPTVDALADDAGDDLQSAGADLGGAQGQEG